MVKSYFTRIIHPVYNHIFGDLNQIQTHLTIDEKITLYRLSKMCKGTVYVEIGSYLGASSGIIALGLSRINSAKLYCIDTWNNDTMSEGPRDTYNEFLVNTEKFSSTIIPLRGESQNIAPSFHEMVDFLFIDGDHSYQGVKNDVDLWLPKLNSNGLLIMHDIGWADGVQRVIKEEITPLAKHQGRLPNMYWAWI